MNRGIGPLECYPSASSVLTICRLKYIPTHFHSAPRRQLRIRCSWPVDTLKRVTLQIGI